MTNPINSGPIAPQRNPQIHPDWYAPRYFAISSITRGRTTTITTTDPNDYVVGQTVRLNIPVYFGIQEINGQQAQVIQTPADDEFVINIDSSLFSPFVSSPTYSTTLPYVVPIGDINSGYISTTGRSVPEVSIPGSFINISPTIGG